MTYEQLLEENEMLRWQLSELLATDLVNPVPALNGVKFRMVNLMANRAPNIVLYEGLCVAINPSVLEEPMHPNTLKVHMVRIRQALKRNSPEDEGKRRRLQAEATEGRLNEHTHNVVKTWQRRSEPSGSCMAWVVKYGKAMRCNKPCKGQLCDEHAHTTRPLGSPLGRRDWL